MTVRFVENHRIPNSYVADRKNLRVKTKTLNTLLLCTVTWPSMLLKKKLRVILVGVGLTDLRGPRKGSLASGKSEEKRIT